LGIVLSFAFNWEKYGLVVGKKIIFLVVRFYLIYKIFKVGDIPKGLPSISIPSFKYFTLQLISDAIVLSMVIFISNFYIFYFDFHIFFLLFYIL
jgi:hypothetical protein